MRSTDPTRPSPALALAQATAAQLQQCLDQQGQALLAVPGGSTPVLYFHHLRSMDLDWQRVHIILTDERCVPHDDPRSNTQLVRQHLLQDAAAKANFHPFFSAQEPQTGTPIGAIAQQAEQRLAHLPWPIDIVVLGMGEDGHTASLFAQAEGLEAALQGPARIAALQPKNEPGDPKQAAPSAAQLPRLSLSLPTLVEAVHAHLLIYGPTKHQVYTQACLGPDAAKPVSLLLHQRQQNGQPVQLWYADTPS